MSMKVNVNGTMIDDTMTLTYASNPKRVGFKAYDRYELYSTCTTLSAYIDVAEKQYAKADLRYDESKGYLIITDADGIVQNSTTDTPKAAAAAEPALTAEQLMQQLIHLGH